jgi:hypothetical protein
MHRLELDSLFCQCDCSSYPLCANRFSVHDQMSVASLYCFQWSQSMIEISISSRIICDSSSLMMNKRLCVTVVFVETMFLTGSNKSRTSNIYIYRVIDWVREKSRCLGWQDKGSWDKQRWISYSSVDCTDRCCSLAASSHHNLFQSE